MPGQGDTSMFNFGQSFGVLKGVCSAMQLPMYFVRPAKWKKYFKETGGYFIVNNPTEALDKSQGKSVISSSLKPKNKRS